MISLYEALGIEKSATADDVRAGYRRASKRAHPDAGGSREDFDKITQAKNVLLDPRRRAHYDATGKIDEPEIDNTQAQILAFAIGAVTATVDQFINMGDMQALDHTDVIALAKDNLRTQLADVRVREKKVREDAKKLCRIAKKFRSKKEGTENRLTASFNNRAADIEHIGDKMLDDIKILEGALAVLDDHEFDYEKMSARGENYYSRVGLGGGILGGLGGQWGGGLG